MGPCLGKSRGECLNASPAEAKILILVTIIMNIVEFVTIIDI